MTYTFILQNVERPDSPAQNAVTMRRVVDHCDVAAFNEAQEPATRAWIRKLASRWDWYVAGENIMLWKEDRFTDKGQRSKLIMHGGSNGALGSSKKDKRRRGPNRYYQVVNLHETSTNKMVRHVNTHLTAKAYTTQKWRKPMHTQSVNNLRKGVQAMRKAQPTWPIVVSGDMNTIKTLNLGPGFKRVNLPASFGKRKYDHVYIYGKIRVDRPSAIKTYSDHKGMKMRITLL